MTDTILINKRNEVQEITENIFISCDLNVKISTRTLTKVIKTHMEEIPDLVQEISVSVIHNINDSKLKVEELLDQAIKDKEYIVVIDQKPSDPLDFKKKQIDKLEAEGKIIIREFYKQIKLKNHATLLHDNEELSDCFYLEMSSQANKKMTELELKLKNLNKQIDEILIQLY